MRLELERQKKQFKEDLDDIRSRLLAQKEQEVSEVRTKYERIIDDMKRNSMNDKEFV